MTTLCRPYLQRRLLGTNDGVTNVQIIVISEVASATAPLPGQCLVALVANEDDRLFVAYTVEDTEAEVGVDDRGDAAIPDSPQLVFSTVTVAVELDGLEFSGFAVRDVQDIVEVDVAEDECGHG